MFSTTNTVFLIGILVGRVLCTREDSCERNTRADLKQKEPPIHSGMV